MVTLREYTHADADRLVDLADNANVSRYLVDTFPYPYTRQNAQWWIEMGSSMNHAVTKVIEYQGRFVGSVGILPQTGWKHHSAEIGYWIGEAYWNKGIATEALRLMREIAYSQLQFQKLFAPVLAPNKASMRVLAKCGFELEGILKMDVIKNGQAFDVYHYSSFAPVTDAK